MRARKFARHARLFRWPWIGRGSQLRESIPVLHSKKIVVIAGAWLLLGAWNVSAQGEQIFKGKICVGSEGRTPTVVNGETTLPCLVPHPKRGVKYILFNAENKTTYHLDGHWKAKSFVGMEVDLVGTLDTATGTIYVDEINRALPAKIMQASSVYIDCDACPRGMAAAWRAAFDEIENWGRFDITPDPKKADLIFIFSANPYLGDYVTRDGPDTRGVKVNITYMDVVDPLTGRGLWGDSREWGSLFVAKATKDLILELKLRMVEESQSDPQSLLNKRAGRKGAPAPGS
jgi:hypothetical protein